MADQHALGQSVIGRVEAIFSYGVFVRLKDQTRADIRRRELSLAGDLEPQKVVQLGQEIAARVYHLPQTGRILELSHKATLPDPWSIWLQKFDEGAVVEGTVKDIRPYGIFVEIVPGVTGLVPASDLNNWQLEKPEELFWIGDRVEAIITRLDRYTKKIRLSIQRRRDQLTQITTFMEHLDALPAGEQKTSQDRQRAKANTQLPLELKSTSEEFDRIDLIPLEFRQRIGRILVVEDSTAICEPLVAWLCRQGYGVDAAHTDAETRKQLSQQRYGLLLVDIDLAEINGLTLMQQMQGTLAGTHIAIMSAPERMQEYANVIESLGVVETFVKPLDLEEIEGFLIRVGRGDPLLPWRATIAPQSLPSMAVIPLPPFTASSNGHDSSTDQIGRSLEQLTKSVRAEVGAIFQRDPVSQTISILAWMGSASVGEGALYTLKESPVKDLIEEGGFIFESHVSTQAEGRFRKLLDLLPFESCIGVPIATGGNIQYALFLFHCQANVFHRYHLRDAMATATLCAAFLERSLLHQRAQALNKLLLSGQLTASFGHEVFNKLSGLEIQLRNLRTDCGSLVQLQLVGNLLEVTNVNGSSMKQDLDLLIETARDLHRIVENFQHLMRSEEEACLEVGDTLSRVIAQVRPLAQQHSVKIKYSCPPNLPSILGRPVHLQQVLLNLMLNAIQHMGMGQGGGQTLEITVIYQEAIHERPLKVRITDSGMGIHKQRWEKIFDLGFTTRPGGSGLGLFIARSLVESMGGMLRVERSIVPLGTTFLIELPVITQTEEKTNDNTTPTRAVSR